MEPVLATMLREDEIVVATALGLVGHNPLLQALSVKTGRAWLAATNQRLLAIWLSRSSLTPNGLEEWDARRLTFGPWKSGLFPGAAMNVDGVGETALHFQLAKAEDGRRLLSAVLAVSKPSSDG